MNRPRRIATVLAAALLAVPFGASHASATDDTMPDSSSTTSIDSAPSTTATSTTTTLPPVSPAQRGRTEIGFARIILDEQRAYVFNTRRRLIATLPVSTGTDDQTPVGTFKVYSKSAQTFFSPDPKERMRWMTRFTKGREGAAIGFHGIPYRVTKNGEVPIFTPLGQYPVSHGCIRVRVSDAKWIFDNMKLGTTVSVLRTRR
jgi:lipoprotein-anchoring transpeptidase ErfK/SrfK